jgi:hypothetical protein
MSYKDYLNKLLNESVLDLLKPMSKEEQDKISKEREDGLFNDITDPHSSYFDWMMFLYKSHKNDSLRKLFSMVVDETLYQEELPNLSDKSYVKLVSRLADWFNRNKTKLGLV